MKRRENPKPINYKRPLPEGLSTDPQLCKWVKRIKGDASARPRDLSEAQLAWVYREVMRDRPEFSPAKGDRYLKAMAETCPILAAPQLERTKLAEDLELIFGQPEMQAMWNSWDGRRGESGPKPDFMPAKALMATMGMAGISPHVDDNYAELEGNNKLWNLFERLEGQGPKRLFSWQHLCKQLPKVADSSVVMATNIEMIKALAALHSGKGIGERLLIDGMGFPAWCEQKPKGKTERQEQWRRRRCPEAGARAIQRGHRHKRDVKSTDRAKQFMVSGNFWRGYYLVAIADQATGLPLVWMVQDAALDEAAAIVPLLSRLYRLWPDCPAKAIAGDSAWDEKAWCRLCELDYGIHPIFRWHDGRSEEINVEGFSRKEKVVARTNKGQLICAAHRKILAFRGTEVPARTGLYSGQTNPKEGEFRVRATCPDGCGHLSLRMKADWRRLTHYPHFDQGGPAPHRYAYREAMLTRLNGVEAIWERLQVGRHLGNEGGNRTRVKDKAAHETIVSLALLSMTAATLADQRERAGIAFPAPGSGAGQPAVPTATGNGAGGSGRGSRAKAPTGSSAANGSRHNHAGAPATAAAAAPAPPLSAGEIFADLLAQQDVVLGI